MSGSRRWRSDVPHRGWTCIIIDDTGHAEANCEICRRERVRYVHVMKHEDHPDQLRCGCVCAGHMESDPAAARDREKSLKRKLKADARWPDRADGSGQRLETSTARRTAPISLFSEKPGAGDRVTPPGGRRSRAAIFRLRRMPSLVCGSCCCVTDRIWKIRNSDQLNMRARTYSRDCVRASGTAEGPVAAVPRADARTWHRTACVAACATGGYSRSFCSCKASRSLIAASRSAIGQQ